MGKISQCARSCPHLYRQCQGPGGAEHYSQTEHLSPAGFGTDWELGKKHVPAVPRKLWHHTGKAEWEQRWVCLGWYPGNGCLVRSIGVSCKEKGLLLGTLLWHKMGAK